jgi:hypothetical protein
VKYKFSHRFKKGEIDAGDGLRKDEISPYQVEDVPDNLDRESCDLWKNVWVYCATAGEHKWYQGHCKFCTILCTVMGLLVKRTLGVSSRQFPYGSIQVFASRSSSAVGL